MSRRRIFKRYDDFYRSAPRIRSREQEKEGERRREAKKERAEAHAYKRVKAKSPLRRGEFSGGKATAARHTRTLTCECGECTSIYAPIYVFFECPFCVVRKIGGARFTFVA